MLLLLLVTFSVVQTLSRNRELQLSLPTTSQTLSGYTPQIQTLPSISILLPTTPPLLPVVKTVAVFQCKTRSPQTRSQTLIPLSPPRTAHNLPTLFLLRWSRTVTFLPRHVAQPQASNPLSFQLVLLLLVPHDPRTSTFVSIRCRRHSIWNTSTYQANHSVLQMLHTLTLPGPVYLRSLRAPHA